MRVRAAVAADSAPVAVLESAVFGADAWSEAAVRAELTADPQGRGALVAEVAGAVAGHALLRIAGGSAELYRIAVAPGHRRKGVGSALLDALLVDAWRRGCDAVFLEVRADNVAARSLYARFGFTEVSRRRRYYADRTDALVLRASSPLSNVCEQR